MTGLRELLDAATPQPWRVQGWDDAEHAWFVTGGGPEFSAIEYGIFCALAWLDEGADSPRPRANVHLAALAPELARLVLDMGEALGRLIEDAEPDAHATSEPHPVPGKCHWCDARRALARLYRIGKGEA